uniref:Uncharacterized protein n=1 Tax=Romanomermis culicivorax TaxID=13658 RepID=A0A915IUL6_ROMCU
MKKCDQFYNRKIRSLRVGNQKLLAYLPIILKYKLKSSIQISIPYAAALDVEILSRHRLENRPAMDEYHQFYAAVFEAKLK